jgi:hypothetical protein
LTLGAAAVVLPIAFTLVGALAARWAPAGDNAVIELQTMDVPGHLPLFGVFSRYGFHHPGPALFFVYVLPVRLFGARGLLVGAGLVNAAAVTGIVISLYRRGGRALLAIGVVLLLVFEHAFASQFLDPWNSWVAVLPFGLAVVLAWSVWCRDWWALPPLALVASFVVQTHVGYALLALWLVGSAVVVAVGRRRVREVAFAGGALVMAWALPIWDQFRGAGNLGLIVEHFSSGSDAVVGWSNAAGLLAREMGIRAPWLGGDEPTAAFTAGVEGASLLTLVPLAAAVVAGIVLAWRPSSSPSISTSTSSSAAARWTAVRRLQLVLVGTGVVSYVSVARITGEAYPYLIRWLWIVAIGLWLSALWAIWLAVSPRLVPRLADVDGSVVLNVTALAVLIVSGWAASAGAPTPAPQPEFSAAITSLADPVADAARGRGNLLLLPEGSSYGEVQSGLVPELERRGVTVMVRDEDGFKYGSHRQANGRRVDARLVVAVNQAVDARDAAGAVPIARFDPLSPSERAELMVLTAKYTRQVQETERGESPSDPMTRDDVARVEQFHARGHLVAVYLDPGPIPPR